MQIPIHQQEKDTSTRQKSFEQEYIQMAHELDAIFNASISAVYSAEVIRDENGKVQDIRFIRVNDNFLRLHSFKKENIVNNRLLAISPQTKDTLFLQSVEKVMLTGKPVMDVLHYAHLQQWFEFSMVKLDDDKICVTYNNITAQQLNLLEIQRQKTLLHNILHYSANGISVTEAIRDERGHVINWKTILANESAAKFIGMSLDELLQKTTYEIAPDLADSPTARAALATLESGAPFAQQIHLSQIGKWLEITVSRLDEDHLINIFTDITASKQAQVELEKLVEELKRSNANLEEFTRAASHDLKEPIRQVHFYTDKLKAALTSKLSPEEQGMFGRVENAAERMRLLVDDLLEYSHASLGAANKEEIDLNAKLKLVLDDLELLIREKKAQITTGKLPVIKGYRRQIQQLFQNIISNALKYSKPGVPPEITVQSCTVTGQSSVCGIQQQDMDKEFYCIEISDNGIGFEQSQADSIFNVFTRLHSNTEYIGTGIGLSIARKVLENHQGYICAKSEPGQGATFIILFPVL